MNAYMGAQDRQWQPTRQGKVRDIYDFGDVLLIITTDRISAFDWILPTGIPDKGRILNLMTEFWLSQFPGVKNHLITTNWEEIQDELQRREVDPYFFDCDNWGGRCALVHKANPYPVECVVRGYLIGSGWREYQKEGSVCGITLPEGMQQAQVLIPSIFTPATKEELGHDVNISFEQMVNVLNNRELAERLRDTSFDIYNTGLQLAQDKGIIIADTKFEFGEVNGELAIIDEVLTPDSSRFWPANQYRVGMSPPSYDKQYVRDWLDESGWDKESDPPELPGDVVALTRSKYIEAYETLTGCEFYWK